MSADAAWEALNESVRDYAPPCTGLDVFTADRLSDEARAACASICASCPVADLCGAYATEAKVDSGYWAGRSYPQKGRSAP